MVEGWRIGFVSDHRLSGEGASSWIGTSFGDRKLLPGLQVPDLNFSVDLEEGLPESNLTTFKVLDEELLDPTAGTLARLFGAEDIAADLIGERLKPTDDPAPASILANGGDGAALHGRHIAGEAIGPAGERRYYPVFPANTIPGPDHAALDPDDPGDVPLTEITDEPKVVAGRRVALYRLFRDTDSLDASPDDWPDWTAQADGQGLVWWGTLRDVGASTGRRWALSCFGWESWLRRQLNVRSSPRWYPVSAPLVLDDAEGNVENRVLVALRREQGGNPTTQQDGIRSFLPADALATTYVSRLDLANDIGTVVAAAEADIGINGQWTTNSLNPALTFNQNFVRIRIDDDAVTPTEAKAWVIMHEKVWRFLGWDPIGQDTAAAEIKTEFDVVFEKILPGELFIGNGVDSIVPSGTPYYIGVFSTNALNNDNSEHVDNDGVDRIYRPASLGGVSVIDPAAGQEVALSIAPNKIYIETQLGRPPANVEVGGVQADASRWFAFRGPLATSQGENTETEDKLYVAKCSWADDSGSIGTDTGGTKRVIHIDRWEDPRVLGIDDTRLELGWASNVSKAPFVEATPLAVLTYATQDEFDFAHHVLLRLLLSTGTASWGAGQYEDDIDPPVFTKGVNDHPDATGSLEKEVQSDLEIADLGLAIPDDLVDWTSFQDAAEALPGGKISDLNRVKYAFHGPKQAEDIIADLIAPRNWIFALRGRKYGIFLLTADLVPGDEDFALGTSDLHGDPSDLTRTIPRARLKAVAAFDSVEVEYGHDPIEGNTSLSRQIQAKDPGSTTRQGRRKRRQGGVGGIERSPDRLRPSGRGLPAVEFWKGDTTGVPIWSDEFDSLWSYQAARWHARPHMMVQGLRVSRPKGQDLYPGSIVRLTNPWPANTEGSYGLVGQMGRVVRVTHESKSCAAVCDILVQAGTVAQARFFAPLAFVVEEGVTDTNDRYDPGTFTLKCEGDYLDHGAGVSDVAAFVEPAWSAFGGDALIHGWQYNGRDWTQTFSGNVASVDTGTHEITLTGAITGVFKEAQPAFIVMAPYDVQTALWVKELFAVVTKANGKFGGGPTQGFKLMAG